MDDSSSLSVLELHRYSRHLSLAEIGIAGQKKLKEAKVLCVGAGGLGSPMVLYLAAAGVGTIGIIDPDLVEVSNLQRQVLYTEAMCGQPKVVAAKERLLQLNPLIKIEIFHEALNENNALCIIKNFDIVADGSDNFATRFLVNDACFHHKKPNVFASIFQFEGQLSLFTNTDGPCYRCLYPEAPAANLVPSCAEGGVLGVLPGIMGTLQALEVIKLILSLGEAMTGRLLFFDALSMNFKEFTVAKNEECALCAKNTRFDALKRPQRTPCDIPIEHISVQELNELILKNVDFMLLDVREPYEYEICNLGGQLYPLAQLQDALSSFNKQQLIIVHCKSGGRSATAATLLREHGFSNVRNLTGGIVQWIAQINPNLTTY